ncbi:MAG: GNAT family N-acetyltransferase [Sulfurimonas sp.]|nr:GNAT family N-acetyltransferase [Sulfurimonas sp.]
MNFKFVEVISEELLEKVFEFRYKVITQTEIFKEYVDANHYVDNKESDIYDPYSVHFAVLDELENVCATVRLIYNSPHGYPAENCMVFERTLFQRDKLGELSRIFIDAAYRDMVTTKHIIHHLNELLYVKMRYLGIEYTYGALEPRFVRLLRIYRMCYEPLAEKQLHGKMGLRYPCILYTTRLGEDNPEFIQKWNESYAKQTV